MSLYITCHQFLFEMRKMRLVHHIFIEAEFYSSCTPVLYCRGGNETPIDALMSQVSESGTPHSNGNSAAAIGSERLTIPTIDTRVWSYPGVKCDTLE